MAFTTCRPIFFYNNCHGYRTENFLPISIFTSFELGTCICRRPPLYNQSRYRFIESFQNFSLLVYHSILVCCFSIFNLMIFLTFRKILYCKLNQLQWPLHFWSTTLSWKMWNTYLKKWKIIYKFVSLLKPRNIFTMFDPWILIKLSRKGILKINLIFKLKGPWCITQYDFCIRLLSKQWCLNNWVYDSCVC